MPVIVRLKHCVILMYSRDHNPPHVHVRTPDGAAVMRIADQALMHGRIDRRAVREAAGWVATHREVLEQHWQELKGQ